MTVIFIFQFCICDRGTDTNLIKIERNWTAAAAGGHFLGLVFWSLIVTARCDVVYFSWVSEVVVDNLLKAGIPHKARWFFFEIPQEITEFYMLAQKNDVGEPFYNAKS